MAIGSIPNGCGIVLDVMQFAKRHRASYNKKPEVKKVVKATEGAEEAAQEDSSESCEPLDPTVTESEFDEGTIKGLLAGVWVSIHRSFVEVSWRFRYRGQGRCLANVNFR